MPTEQRTKRPPPSGPGAESGDETRGVGTIGSVRQRVEGFCGWPVRRVIQPLRWWLRGDTDAMWLDRSGEDTDRLFSHGFAERLPPPVTVRSARDGLDPDQVGGACNHRRSVGSARHASPGLRMDSTAWPKGYSWTSRRADQRSC